MLIIPVSMSPLSKVCARTCASQNHLNAQVQSMNFSPAGPRMGTIDWPNAQMFGLHLEKVFTSVASPSSSGRQGPRRGFRFPAGFNPTVTQTLSHMLTGQVLLFGSLGQYLTLFSLTPANSAHSKLASQILQCQPPFEPSECDWND
jgi:hypothetical protein